MAWPAPSHHMNQCSHIVYWTPGNIFQWNSHKNTINFIQENTFEKVVREIAAILSRSHCVIGSSSGKVTPICTLIYMYVFTKELHYLGSVYSYVSVSNWVIWGRLSLSVQYLEPTIPLEMTSGDAIKCSVIHKKSNSAFYIRNGMFLSFMRCCHVSTPPSESHDTLDTTNMKKAWCRHGSMQCRC